MSEREWQEEEDLRRQKEILVALEAAKAAGTPIEQLEVLAYECGVGMIWKGRKA